MFYLKCPFHPAPSYPPSRTLASHLITILTYFPSQAPKPTAFSTSPNCTEKSSLQRHPMPSHPPIRSFHPITSNWRGWDFMEWAGEDVEEMSILQENVWVGSDEKKDENGFDGAIGIRKVRGGDLRGTEARSKWEKMGKTEQPRTLRTGKSETEIEVGRCWEKKSIPNQPNPIQHVDRADSSTPRHTASRPKVRGLEEQVARLKHIIASSSSRDGSKREVKKKQKMATARKRETGMKRSISPENGRSDNSRSPDADNLFGYDSNPEIVLSEASNKPSCSGTAENPDIVMEDLGFSIQNFIDEFLAEDTGPANYLAGSLGSYQQNRGCEVVSEGYNQHLPEGLVLGDIGTDLNIDFDKMNLHPQEDEDPVESLKWTWPERPQYDDNGVLLSSSRLPGDGSLQFPELVNAFNSEVATGSHDELMPDYIDEEVPFHKSALDREQDGSYNAHDPDSTSRNRMSQPAKKWNGEGKNASGFNPTRGHNPHKAPNKDCVPQNGQPHQASPFPPHSLVMEPFNHNYQYLGYEGQNVDVQNNNYDDANGYQEPANGGEPNLITNYFLNPDGAYALNPDCTYALNQDKNHPQQPDENPEPPATNPRYPGVPPGTCGWLLYNGEWTLFQNGVPVGATPPPSPSPAISLSPHPHQYYIPPPDWVPPEPGEPARPLTPPFPWAVFLRSIPPEELQQFCSESRLERARRLGYARMDEDELMEAVERDNAIINAMCERDEFLHGPIKWKTPEEIEEEKRMSKKGGVKVKLRGKGYKPRFQGGKESPVKVVGEGKGKKGGRKGRPRRKSKVGDYDGGEDEDESGDSSELSELESETDSMELSEDEDDDMDEDEVSDEEADEEEELSEEGDDGAPEDEESEIEQIAPAPPPTKQRTRKQIPKPASKKDGVAVQVDGRKAPATAPKRRGRPAKNNTQQDTNHRSAVSSESSSGKKPKQTNYKNGAPAESLEAAEMDVDNDIGPQQQQNTRKRGRPKKNSISRAVSNIMVQNDADKVGAREKTPAAAGPKTRGRARKNQQLVEEEVIEVSLRRSPRKVAPRKPTKH